MPALKNSLGSLAAIAALAALPHAKAQIVDSSFSNLSLVDNGALYLDIDDDGNDDFNITSGSAEISGMILGNEVAVSGGMATQWFMVGDLINGSSDFNSIGDFSSFANGGTSYFGVMFQRGGQTHYGWVKLDFPTTDLADATVVSGAWQSTANLGINAGATAVPEPATTGLLAGLFASLGLFLRRHLRRKRA